MPTATLKTSGSFQNSSTAAAGKTGTFGAITVAAGSWIVVALGAVKPSTTASDPVATCTGLTFSVITTAEQAVTNMAKVSLLAAYDATGGSRTVTITENLGTYGIFGWVYEVSGAPSSSAFGATAAVADTTLSGAKTITLSAAPASSSVVIAAMIEDSNASATNHVDVGSGWTEDVGGELSESGGGGGYGQVQQRTGSTSTSVSWAEIKPAGNTTTFSFAGAAVEVKSGSTNATVTFTQNLSIHP